MISKDERELIDEVVKLIELEEKQPKIKAPNYCGSDYYPEIISPSYTMSKNFEKLIISAYEKSLNKEDIPLPIVVNLKVDNISGKNIGRTEESVKQLIEEYKSRGDK